MFVSKECPRCQKIVSVQLLETQYEEEYEISNYACDECSLIIQELLYIKEDSEE